MEEFQSWSLIQEIVSSSSVYKVDSVCSFFTLCDQDFFVHGLACGGSRVGR